MNVRGTATKARIARMARRLFLRRGVDGVSMRKIAGAVNLSATAIYRHYRDKDELLDEITEEGFRLFREYLSDALGAPTPLDRMHGLADRYLDFAMEHPRHYDFIFSLPRRNVRTFPGDFASRHDLTFHILSDQVEQAIQEGQMVLDDPLEVALSIWSHVHGLVALQRAGRFGHDEEEIRTIYRRSLDRLIRGLSTEPARKRSER